MGGNIGLPILAQDPLPEGGVYVLELSSYQIDLTFSLDCDVAVLLNITPDHLDRYDGFPAYSASKRRLFEMQSEAGIGIFNEEDEEVWQIWHQAEMGQWTYGGRYWSQIHSSALNDVATSISLRGVKGGKGGQIRLDQKEW